MSDRVGAYEAKTHLSKLLDRVSRGERITITRHGVPVAVLVPAEEQRSQPVEDVVREIEAFREGKSLGPLELEDLIEEGRT